MQIAIFFEYWPVTIATLPAKEIVMRLCGMILNVIAVRFVINKGL